MFNYGDVDREGLIIIDTIIQEGFFKYQSFNFNSKLLKFAEGIKKG